MENTYDSCNKQRGHMRSASLENANSILAKNTLGLPVVQPGFTGTLKSKNEQRRLKNKFGSHNNLEDYVGHRKSKFQNLRNMFEMKSEYDLNRIPQKPSVEFNENLSIIEHNSMQTNSLPPIDHTNQNKPIVRPIAFKPIPFEPDYSIPNRYNDMCDRYGSTPSLVPAAGSHLKFGSTSDLRHGYGYCSNLLARRRCSRSLKINDSMESVRQTPDSDATSNSSTKKFSNKYSQDQFDITPSPSDSGVSDLETALKDRDSELAYLRQTMEHNEKVIFKVHKQDKEAFWENETRRLKTLYESQQKEYMQKIKKLEQMLTLQSFQFKQNKLRQSEDSTRLKEQFGDLTNENELLRSEIESFKVTEKTLKDRIDQLEEKIEVMDKLIANLKGQLEENEWTVCQKNGEIALLKTQLKEAKIELTTKDHEMVHLKTEVQSRPVQVAEIKKLPDVKNNYDSDLEISQLNRIIILKDQVILAMTSELAKLRKELSDLAIYHEYGEEPSGKYSRLKYKIDNLANICNQEAVVCSDSQPFSSLPILRPKENTHSSDLDIIINCLKASACFMDETNLNSISSCNFKNDDIGCDSISGIEKLNFHNLPDVTLSNVSTNSTNANCDEPTYPEACNDNEVNNKILQQAESENDNSVGDRCLNEKEQLEQVRKELAQLRITFETEKLQWADEKEKVMTYQRKLQMHYINMYQKMKDLESKLLKKY